MLSERSTRWDRVRHLQAHDRTKETTTTRWRENADPK